MKANECTVTLGDGWATIKRSGTRGTTVAQVLGTVKADGVEIICLDRLVHGIFETEMDGWQVSGAVTTLLASLPGPFWRKAAEKDELSGSSDPTFGHMMIPVARPRYRLSEMAPFVPPPLSWGFFWGAVGLLPQLH